jgi:hypothetical protein
MIRIIVIIAIFACCLCPRSSAAEVIVSESVVGAGGDRVSGDKHVVLGTLGQPLIGLQTGPGDNTEGGFWYSPGYVVTAVRDNTDELPTVYKLEQNYPNPFNPQTTITFSLPEESYATLKVYDARGRMVATLVDQTLEPGVHDVILNANNIASGVYFYRLIAGNFVQTRKLVVLK